MLPLSEAITLRRLSWSNWGGSSAYARGVFRVKRNEPYTRVKVRAYRRVHVCTGAATYTRVRVTFPSGRTHTWRTPGCWSS